MRSQRLLNIIWVAFSNLVNLAVNFGISVVLANYLGVNKFGVFMFAYTIFSYLIVLNNYGLKKYVITELPKRYPNSTSALFANTVYIKVMLTIVFGLITLFFSLFSGYDKSVIILIFICSAFVLAFDLQAFYDTYQKSKVDSYFLVLRNVVYFGVTLLLIGINKASVFSISFAFAITTLLYVILQYLFANRQFNGFEFGLTINKKIIREILHRAFPLFWAELMVNIYDKVDILLLSVMKGDHEVGIYSVASRAVSALILVVGAVYRIILPLLSKSQDQKRNNELIENVVQYLAMIVLPMTVWGILASQQIVDLFYGKSFSDSVIPLQIMVLNATIVGIGSIFGTMLLALGKVRYYTLAITIGGILNVVMNLFLIPLYSYIGASIVTVLTELMVSLVGYYVYKTQVNKYFKFKIGKTLVITIIISLAFQLSKNYLPVLINLLICSLIYLVLLYLLSYLPEKRKKHYIKG